MSQELYSNIGNTHLYLQEELQKKKKRERERERERERVITLDCHREHDKAHKSAHTVNQQTSERWFPDIITTLLLL